MSLTDPPAALRDAAAACRNIGTWPVLVGEGDAHGALLADHPAGLPAGRAGEPRRHVRRGEIDQLLRLSILSMTDEEKAEMRASDPRAREILERTESLSDEELMRLHGTVREFGLAR